MIRLHLNNCDLGQVSLFTIRSNLIFFGSTDKNEINKYGNTREIKDRQKFLNQSTHFFTVVYNHL